MGQSRSRGGPGGFQEASRGGLEGSTVCRGVSGNTEKLKSTHKNVPELYG